MFQVRFHGRGGQGVVTAAELLSVAAFLEQRHTQAFPSFGCDLDGRVDHRVERCAARMSDGAASPDSAGLDIIAIYSLTFRAMASRSSALAREL